MAYYQAARGDTWASVAQRLYGGLSYLPNLARANPSISFLRPGVVLSAPGNGPSWQRYGNFTPTWGTQARQPTSAPRPGVSNGPPASFYQAAAGYGARFPSATPVYGPTGYNQGRAAPTQAPRPGPQSSPGGMPPYQPGQGPWLPPQAYLRPDQYTGRPYQAPVPTQAPRPGQQGAPAAAGQGSRPEAQWPWFDVYGRPGGGTGVAPTYGVFMPPGGGGGGYGGYGGWGGGGRGKAKKTGTVSLIADQQPSYNYSPSSTGRQVDYLNSLGYIHWRV